MMSDLIGTVRREEHEGGFSIWAKVAAAQVHAYNPVRTIVSAEWLCVFSTAEGNCGERLHRVMVERDSNPIVGVIPGTPAAQPEADSCPYTHAHTRHFCGRTSCRES